MQHGDVKPELIFLNPVATLDFYVKIIVMKVYLEIAMNELTGLGYGSPAEILARLPEGTKTVIRDDAAAECDAIHAWWASPLSREAAEAAYCDDEFVGATYTVAGLRRAAELS